MPDVRKPDFVRLIKEPMSRDWVEKDRLLGSRSDGPEGPACIYMQLYVYIKRIYVHMYTDTETYTCICI